MGTNKVKEQFLLATDEETPEAKLQEIWKTSKSVRVRKAVASNPNAGPGVLKEAARLYLEEVLSNPGFTVLELFDDDPWISKLSMAYSSPWDFLLQYGHRAHYARSSSAGWDHFGWAVLLSRELSPPAMEKALSFMTIGTLRRALKNASLTQKLTGLYDKAERANNTWPFSLETMITLHCEKVISTEQLFRGLSGFGPGSTSARKSVYTKYIKWIQESYRDTSDPAKKEFLPKLLAKSVLISRSHVLHWIWEGFSTRELNEWAGELYCDAYSHMLGYSGSALIHDNLRGVGRVVGDFVKEKFLDRDGPPKFSEAYSFIKSKNLQDQKFSKLGIVLTDREWMEKLDKCPDEVKEFFCKSGCLGAWASATGTDIKYKIVDSVNWGIYLREGVGESNLLFNSCSVRKVVSLEAGTYVG